MSHVHGTDGPEQNNTVPTTSGNNARGSPRLQRVSRDNSRKPTPPDSVNESSDESSQKSTTSVLGQPSSAAGWLSLLAAALRDSALAATIGTPNQPIIVSTIDGPNNRYGMSFYEFM